jgi:integrase
MGRKSKRTNAIPRLRLRKRGKVTYYFYDLGGTPRKEISLGTDYALAAKKWGEIENDRASAGRHVAAIITFDFVANEYIAKVIPTKAPRTQKENLREISKLKEYFNDPPGPLEDIEPLDVKQYLNWRSVSAKVSANREKALLSHIWNFAREEGYTAKANPCAGIKGNKETGRDNYVEDEAFKAVYKEAAQPLRDAMDLAYLVGQRVTDTLEMDERDLRDGFLRVRQNKTGAKRRIEVIGELAGVVKRISDRKAGYRVRSTRLIIDEDGQPLTYNMLYNAFRSARAKAGIAPNDFQFRDLRAKAGTDKADSSGDIRKAQAQLGHTTVTMTEHYVRNRLGDKVTPTK